MTIGGKEYQFNRPVMGLLRKVAKVEAKLNEVFPKMFTDDESFKSFEDSWREYCQLVFQKPDDGLKAENLTPDEIAEIQKSFFGNPGGTPKK